MDGSVAASAHLLAYGDLKNYYVVDRVGTTSELVPHQMGRTVGRPGSAVS